MAFLNRENTNNRELETITPPISPAALMLTTVLELSLIDQEKR